jgi:hypothetical protein
VQEIAQAFGPAHARFPGHGNVADPTHEPAPSQVDGCVSMPPPQKAGEHVVEVLGYMHAPVPIWHPDAPQRPPLRQVVEQQTPPEQMPDAHCALPEQVVPAASSEHWPPTHVRPRPQWTPHAPQFCGSVMTLVSQPSPALWSQSENPALHIEIAHWLLKQPAVAFGKGPQTFPSPPQLFGSVTVFTQTPPALHVPPVHDDPA